MRGKSRVRILKDNINRLSVTTTIVACIRAALLLRTITNIGQNIQTTFLRQ